NMALYPPGYFPPGYFPPGYFPEAEAEVPDLFTITTTSLARGVVGVAYLRTLSVTGTGPVTWSITTGDLPDGLSLDTETGQITGTPTTEEQQTFTVQATNGEDTDTQELTLMILAEQTESLSVFGTPH